jgi:hypothetical protein
MQPFYLSNVQKADTENVTKTEIVSNKRTSKPKVEKDMHILLYAVKMIFNGKRVSLFPSHRPYENVSSILCEPSVVGKQWKDSVFFL